MGQWTEALLVLTVDASVRIGTGRVGMHLRVRREVWRRESRIVADMVSEKGKTTARENLGRWGFGLGFKRDHRALFYGHPRRIHVRESSG